MSLGFEVDIEFYDTNRYEPNSGSANRVEKTNPTGGEHVLLGRMSPGFGIARFCDTNPIPAGETELKKTNLPTGGLPSAVGNSPKRFVRRLLSDAPIIRF